MLLDLAVWYLRKRKRSVLIGYEIKKGEVKSLNKDSLIYDNKFFNVSYKTYDDSPLHIPSGKFEIKRQNTKDS